METTELTKQQQQARSVQYVLLPSSVIDDNPIHNCRGRITSLDVEFLAKDIAKNGLMQPVVVRPLIHGNFTHRVVAGFSRFMALRVLRWKEIPCVIRDCTDEEASFLNLSENLIRKDLNFMQEAEACRKIVLKFPHLNDEEVGNRLGQNRGWVQVRMYALQMPPEVQDVIGKGFVTYDQIKAIHKMDSVEAQLIAIRKIKEARERGLKVKIIHGKMRPANLKDARKRAEMFAMIEHIKESLGTYNFGTRCLAWAAGEISDFELFGDIENIAKHEDIPYVKPARLEMKSFIDEIRGE
jgi:ParB family transcriptional regulator, chromosome partitioning protein